MPAPHPRMHGLTHLPGGPDPIPNLVGGGIQFDVDNEGGWLEITTNDTSPDTGVGLGLYSHTGVEIKNSTDGGFSLSNTTDLGINIEDSYTGSGGDGITISSDNGVHISGGIGTTAGVTLGGRIFMHGLPGFDPGVSGQLWSDSGVVTVSP